MTDAQRALYDDQHLSDKAGGKGGAAPGEYDPNVPSTVMMPMTHKQPCCPWFTCCL
jgi:hypothetical protein